MGLEKIKVSELGVVQDASGFLAFGITGGQNKALNIEAAFNSMIASFASGLVDWTNASANFSTTGTGQFGGDLSANNLSGTNTGDQASGDFDHNSLQNTHNLTTDIDHNSISNSHNLTDDIDHDQLANYVANQHIDWTNATVDLSTLGNLSAANLSGINTGDQQSSDFDHNLLQNSHNLTTDIDHNLITNSHNLTTDINHDLLYNYNANEHIDWTNASANFHTTGIAQIDNATTISGTLTVNGDIVQNGASYVTYPEEVRTNNDFIYLREGAVGGLSAGQYAGFEAVMYDGANNGQLVIDAQGWARVGDVGDLKKIAAIEENTTDGYFMKYDASGMQLVGEELAASHISDFSTAVANNAAVLANSSKVGITPEQASAIEANTAKISSQWTNITGGINFSGGKVGIGTSSPQTLFDLRTSNTSSEVVSQFGNNNVQGGLQVGTENTGLLWYLNALNSRALEFRTNQTSRLRIGSDGKVGIGGVPTIAQMEIFTSSVAPFYVKNSLGKTRLTTSLTNDDADLFLYDRNDVLQVALRSEGDSYFGQGKVGIGKTPTLGTLDVVGTGYFSSTLKANNTIDSVNVSDSGTGQLGSLAGSGGYVLGKDTSGVNKFLIRAYLATGDTQAYFALGGVAIGKTQASLGTLDVAGTGCFSDELTAKSYIVKDLSTTSTFGNYNSDTNPDINSLVSGSLAGALIQGINGGHLVMAIRDNDINDSVSIVSGGGTYTTDATFDKLVAQFKANGSSYIGGELTVQGVTKNYNGNTRLTLNPSSSTLASIYYYDESGSFQDLRLGSSGVNSGIYYDASVYRVGINNDAPTTTLDVNGTGKFSNTVTATDFIIA